MISTYDEEIKKGFESVYSSVPLKKKNPTTLFCFIAHRVRIRLALELPSATPVEGNGAPGCSGGGWPSCDGVQSA